MKKLIEKLISFKNFYIDDFWSLLFFIFIGFCLGLSLAQPPELWISFKLYLLDQYGVDFKGVTARALLFMLVNYFLVGLFGYLLVLPFARKKIKVSRVILFFASFFVGYTCLLGMIRVLSLVLRFNQIYWPTIGLTVFFIGLMSFLYGRDNQPAPENGEDKINVKNFLNSIFFVIFTAVLLCSVLILQIRQGSFSWVGHGTDQYAYILDEWRQNAPLHFPVITKHYDELIFHYFLTAPLTAVFNPIVPWWLTLGLVKVSLFSFLYLMFRQLRISNALSIIFALYLFFGTSSLIPTKYYMLFDSSNFFYYTVHSGRIVGIGITFMFILDALFYWERERRLPLIIFVLAGLGLTATTISNALLLCFYFCFVGSMLYFRQIYPDQPGA